MMNRNDIKEKKPGSFKSHQISKIIININTIRPLISTADL